MYQLTQRLRQLKERGLQFKCEHDLELKIMVLCEDEEKKRNAEDVLEQKIRASLHQSHDGDSFLQMETDRFMSSITSHPNIKPTGITRCCIMVTFTCSTLDGVMHLLDYFSSRDFLNRICNISNELSYLYEDAFLVQGYITLESLSSIQTADCQKDDSEKGISLPLKCSSVEGMAHILETLQNVKTANTLNSIADKISERLEETVSIHVTTNLFEFKDVVKDAGAQGLRSKKCTRGDQALKRSSSKDSHESLDSVSKSFELLKVSVQEEEVSVQEEEDVMENVTDKPVNEMESDCQEKCGRRQRKKENRSHQTDPTQKIVTSAGDFTFPCNPTTRLGLQDSKRLGETSPDDRLMHSLHVRPTNVTADNTYSPLDKMLRLSDSQFTDDHVWQLDRAESTLRELGTSGREFTSEGLNDLQTDIERLIDSLQLDESSSTRVKEWGQYPRITFDRHGCKERLKCLYQVIQK
ncbi:uncharacterized protein LOC132749969 [Ruditapes philippinarum]|uniref:uncharacterized protein LOC132749969 n=1 Tax=Ruditapes philippinarum TaxID=129788 RepID=UPI00295A8C94|nr:uncharacterized protein LOC132749969 [Ruditapes philippinarum]